MTFLTTKQKREDQDGSRNCSIIGHQHPVKVDWYNYDHGGVGCSHDNSTGMICRSRRRKLSILFFSEGCRSVFYGSSSRNNRRIVPVVRVAILAVIVVIMCLQLTVISPATTSRSRITVSAFQIHNDIMKNNMLLSSIPRRRRHLFQSQQEENMKMMTQKTKKKKNIMDFYLMMMINNNNNINNGDNDHHYDNIELNDDNDGTKRTTTPRNNNSAIASLMTTGTRRELFVVMSAAAAATTIASTSSTNNKDVALAMDSTIPSSSTVVAAPTATSDNNNNNSASTTTTSSIDTKAILDKASRRALSGGKAGASAAVVQVLSLMWLRTAMNYQYRYGGNLQKALSTLMSEGGIPRLYQGLPFALLQGPLTRFGDTAANVGVLALLESIDATRELPLPLKTLMGSLSAGLWRILIMPVDTYKTTLQVQGSEAFRELTSTLLREKSIAPLYRGSLASAAATAVGHFPWFLTYNFLNAELPQVSSTDDVLQGLLRSAFIGLCASSVSDITSNSLRVIKTTKQTMMVGGSASGASGSTTTSGSSDSRASTSSANIRNHNKDHNDTTPNHTNKSATVETDKTILLAETKNNIKQLQSQVEDLNYIQIVQRIIEKDGLINGLLLRGLSTRLLVNALQGALFSVLWKYFQTIQQTTGG